MNKKIILILIIIPLLLLSSYLLLKENADRKVKFELQWLSDRGYPTAPEELQTYCQGVNLMDNNRHNVLKAIHSLQKKKELDRRLTELEDSWGVPLNVVRDNLQIYSSAIEECHNELKILDRCFSKNADYYFGVTFNQEGVMRSLVGSPAPFVVWRMLERRAMFKLLNGDSDAALMSVIRLVQIVNSLALQPNFFDQVFRNAIYKRIVSVTSTVCLNGKPSEEVLQEAIGWLQAGLNKRDGLSYALHGERVQYLLCNDHIKKGAIKASDMFGQGSPLFPFEFWLTMDNIFFLQNIRHLEKIISLSYPDAIIEFGEASWFATEDYVPQYYFLSRLFLSNSLGYKICELQATHQASLRLAIVGLRN